MDESRYYKRTMERYDVPSRHLDQPRRVTVYVPPGYDERVDHAVLYCQDGDDFFSMGRVATFAQRLILDEGVEPFVIVGVSVDKAVRTQEYAPEGDRNAAYRRFFSEELVPWIDSHYATRKDPLGRVLAGDSLGGAVSLHLCLDHPGTFRRLISLSGAFYASTRARLAEVADLSWLDMYMTVGTEETAVQTERGVFDFLTENREAHRLLIEKKTRLTYQESPGNHIWGSWQQQLPDALRYFFPPVLPSGRG